jgi:hypothetical protein
MAILKIYYQSDRIDWLAWQMKLHCIDPQASQSFIPAILAIAYGSFVLPEAPSTVFL